MQSKVVICDSDVRGDVSTSGDLPADSCSGRPSAHVIREFGVNSEQLAYVMASVYESAQVGHFPKLFCFEQPRLWPSGILRLPPENRCAT